MDKIVISNAKNKENIMTMHLLPAWVTTTNTRRRKKKKMTKKQLANLAEHNKFLKRMGIDPRETVVTPKLNKKVLNGVGNELPNYETNTPYIPSNGDGIGNCFSKDERYKIEVSKQYTIAPAYNKGGYQVIGKNNIKDIGR